MCSHVRTHIHKYACMHTCTQTYIQLLLDAHAFPVPRSAAPYPFALQWYWYCARPSPRLVLFCNISDSQPSTCNPSLQLSYGCNLTLPAIPTNLSVYLPIYPPIHLCTYFSISLSPSIYLSISLLSLSLSLSLYLSLYLSFYLSLYLSLDLFLYLSLSIFLSIFLSIYLSPYLSFLSIFLSRYLSRCFFKICFLI